jgi:hypothetical protein
MVWKPRLQQTHKKKVLVSTLLGMPSVNQHQKQMSMPSVTKSAVITLIDNLQPQVAKVNTTSQGS